MNVSFTCRVHFGAFLRELTVAVGRLPSSGPQFGQACQELKKRERSCTSQLRFISRMEWSGEGGYDSPQGSSLDGVHAMHSP